MSTIILVQHCQSEHHINNMTGGWTDSVLTDYGKEQAKRTANKVQNILDTSKEQVLYSSDLIRASQTANTIGSRLGLNVIQDKGLREINTGIAIGKTKDWAKKNRNPMKKDSFDLEYREFEDGESWKEFYKRISLCMDQILKQDSKKEIIIVTHGGTLGYIVSWWLKFDPEMLCNAYFQSSVAGITTLNKNRLKQNIISVFNDTSHLVN